MSQSIAEIHAKILPLVGKNYTLPITKNKGLPGIFLQDLLGIPTSQDCLDCSDGELKLFPAKKLKKGTLVPKETIAITMLSRDELLTHDFISSKVYHKMKKMLIVPYYRVEGNIFFLHPTLIHMECAEFAEMYRVLESDYNAIRKNYIETGTLTSKTGKFLQNRTKGPGHGSTSRAFYLRPLFMKECVPLIL